MYYLNCKLLQSLPSILGMTEQSIGEEMGIDVRTYSKAKEGSCQCEMLVKLCNTFRIPLACFITTSKSPVVMYQQSDYVVPADSWSPVEWNYQVLATLFGGKDSKTGIARTKAAERLGFKSHAVFTYWSQSSGSCRIEHLLNLLNEFRLDASMFFTDPNSPLPMPEWMVKEEGPVLVDAINDRLKGYKQLQALNAENEQTIRSLRLENNRLRKEVLSLRTHGTPSPEKKGLLSESRVPYQTMQRGYVFNRQLWQSLPEMFDIPRMEFYERIKAHSKSLSDDYNIRIETLVRACNELRISISHFFLPKNEPVTVYDRGYYQVSINLFQPIESRMENAKYLYGRYSVYGFSIDDFRSQTGYGRDGFTSLSRDGYFSRVNTLTDICSTLNISPLIFFKDENRRKALYSQSQNEILLLNAIDMMKDIEKLRAQVRSFKKRLNEPDTDED